MLTLVDHKNGPIRGSDRPKPATVVEEFAEEMINGIFCQYEPPSKKSYKKTKGILRPPNSFLRDRTGESQKNVRWIDDENAMHHQEGFQYGGDRKQGGSLRSSLGSIDCGKIAQSCLDAGVEAGCMSPTKAKLGGDGDGKQYFDIRSSLSQDSSTISFQRESRAHRYAVFDDEGNPVSTKTGVKAPPRPPPPPPPNKKEVFIPQLCGVELNWIDDTPSNKRPSYPTRTTYSSDHYEDEDNSLLQQPAGVGVDPYIHRTRLDHELTRNKNSPNKQTESVPSQKEASSSVTGSPPSPKKGTRKAAAQAAARSSWEELRNRLDASDDDWDGPDWMAGGQTTDSKDELDAHGRFSIMDPITMDRSDIGVPRMQEDDWDNSLPIIPAARRRGSTTSAANARSKRNLTSVAEDEVESQGMETSLVRIRNSNNNNYNNEDSKSNKDQQKRRNSLFGLGRKSQSRDPSPGRSIRRGSMGRSSDAGSDYNDKSSTADQGTSVSSDKGSKASDWRQRTALIKEKLRRKKENERPRSRSRSPVREFGKRLIEGITTFSPTRASESSSQRGGFDSSASNNEPMPHLHPAHPLNQVRRQLRGDDLLERQSYITAHRNGFVDGSQVGDQDDRISFITAHRRHVDGDQRSQTAMSDQDDRMSFITAYRDQFEGVPPPPPPPPRLPSNAGDTDDKLERQSFIGAHRFMMESPRRQYSHSSPGQVLGSLSTNSSQQPQQQSQPMSVQQSVMAATAAAFPQATTQTIAPTTGTTGAAQVTESSEDKKPKEDELSWEERTRLAWERIRNGLGMSTSEDSANAGKSKDGGTEIAKDAVDASKKASPKGYGEKLSTPPGQVPWQQEQNPPSPLLDVGQQSVSSAAPPNPGYNVASPNRSMSPLSASQPYFIGNINGVNMQPQMQQQYSVLPMPSNYPQVQTTGPLDPNVRNQRGVYYGPNYPLPGVHQMTNNQHLESNHQNQFHNGIAYQQGSNMQRAPPVEAAQNVRLASRPTELLLQPSLGTSSSSPKERNGRRPLKGILKAATPEKKVTFLENFDSMFSCADENEPPPEVQPPEENSQEDSETSEDVISRSEMHIPEVLTESTARVNLPSIQEPQQDIDSTSKKKRRAFPGRKLLAGIRGANKKNNTPPSTNPVENMRSDSSVQRYSEENHTNDPRSYSMQSTVHGPRENGENRTVQPTAPAKQDSGRQELATLIEQELNTHSSGPKVQVATMPQPNLTAQSTNTTGATERLTNTAGGMSPHDSLRITHSGPQSDPVGQRERRRSTSPAALQNHSATGLASQTQQNLPVDPVRPTRNGVVGPAGQPTPISIEREPTGTEKNDGRRSRFSILGISRGRERSRSPSRHTDRSASPVAKRREDAIISLSPTRDGTGFFVGQQYPMVHPYQQGYIYSHQPYAYMNPAYLGQQQSIMYANPSQNNINPANSYTHPIMQPHANFYGQTPQQYQPQVGTVNPGTLQSNIPQPNYDQPLPPQQPQPPQEPKTQGQPPAQKSPQEQQPSGILASFAKMF